MEKQLMNLKEAANFLGISKDYFKILVKRPDSKIPYVLLYPNGKKYYRAEDLRQWVNAHIVVQTTDTVR